VQVETPLLVPTLAAPHHWTLGVLRVITASVRYGDLDVALDPYCAQGENTRLFRGLRHGDAVRFPTDKQRSDSRLRQAIADAGGKIRRVAAGFCSFSDVAARSKLIEGQARVYLPALVEELIEVTVG
jgi:hypothetical protein